MLGTFNSSTLGGAGLLGMLPVLQLQQQQVPWHNCTVALASTAFGPLQLTGPPFFNSQRDLTATVNTTLSLLRVPRTALGIAAASKGAVAGRLLLRAHPGEAYQDCSLTGPAGRAIPGDVGAIDAMSIRQACLCQAYTMHQHKETAVDQWLNDETSRPAPGVSCGCGIACIAA